MEQVDPALWIFFFSLLSLYISFKAVKKIFFEEFNKFKASKKHFFNFEKVKSQFKIKKNESIQKGDEGERKLALILKKNFGKDKVFANLYIEKRVNVFSQIDVVLLHPSGIIVFEVKNYSGWVLGDGKARMWTKILGYGNERFHFYNPVFQNEGHIRAIRSQLQDKDIDIPIYSVIVFDGECVLKNISNIPKNTYVIYLKDTVSFLRKFLKEHNKVKYDDVNIAKLFRKNVRNSHKREIVKKHLKQVKVLQKNNKS